MKLVCKRLDGILYLYVNDKDGKLLISASKHIDTELCEDSEYEFVDIEKV